MVRFSAQTRGFVVKCSRIRRHLSTNRLVAGVVAVLLVTFGASLTSAGASVKRATSTTSAAEATPTSNTDVSHLKPHPLKNPVTIKAGLSAAGQEAYAALLLAQEFGEFKKENITLESSVLQGTDIVVLLTQNQLQIAPIGYGAGLLNTINSGAQNVSIGGMVKLPPSSNQGFFVRKELAKADGTVDPCALKGKSVSFGGPTGLSSVSTYYLNSWFQTCKNPFTIKDVTVNTLAGATLATALQAGSVDAGFISDPVATVVKNAGYAVLALPQPHVSLGGYFVSAETYKNTALATAIARALLRTIRTYLQGDYHSNPKVMAGLVKVLGLPQATIAAGPSLVWDPDMTTATDPITQLQKTYIQVGGILTYTKPIPATRVFTDRFVKRALAGK
jgi:NitT/TauT family transport system substrate-binding protein